jgi:hypothetical protein
MGRASGKTLKELKATSLPLTFLPAQDHLRKEGLRVSRRIVVKQQKRRVRNHLPSLDPLFPNLNYIGRESLGVTTGPRDTQTLSEQSAAVPIGRHHPATHCCLPDRQCLLVPLMLPYTYSRQGHPDCCYADNHNKLIHCCVATDRRR